MVASPSTVPRGTRIGPYEVIRHLQNGSMSELFLAQRAGGGDYNRRVALKRIHPYLANQPDFVHMFMDEARIASLISHPNVCPIVDFGSDHDDHYIAMDYLVGEPLAEIVEALDGLPEARRSRAFYSIIATIIADAAEGLHAAHELRDSTGAPLHVVHRDVSPGNIFVNYDGSVRIVDFGFAKARANVNETAPGMLKGTFAYMAPEQITGNANRRSDIWGLGVVLWELLSGHRLFARPGIKAILAAIQSDAIPNPRETDPEVPEDLAEIVMTCLERRPEDRFPSARILSQRLRRFAIESGAVIGPGEIAAWLKFIFPGGQEKRRALSQEDSLPTDATVSLDGRPSRTSLVAFSRDKKKQRAFWILWSIQWILLVALLFLLLRD